MQMNLPGPRDRREQAHRLERDHGALRAQRVELGLGVCDARVERARVLVRGVHQVHPIEVLRRRGHLRGFRAEVEYLFGPGDERAEARLVVPVALE